MTRKTATKTAKRTGSAASIASKATSKDTESGEAPAKQPAKRAGGGAKATAERILGEPNAAQQVAELGGQLLQEKGAQATQAARVLDEVCGQKPELLVPVVDKLARAVGGGNKRAAQTAAEALPIVARLAPARVARQLDLLKETYESATEPGKDGMVRTFAALCTASVAYQKRLEPILTVALGQADGKMLLRWSEIVLPSLKGEPHARARAVVEKRIYEVPRPQAQKVADFLGIKLRPAAGR